MSPTDPRRRPAKAACLISTIVVGLMTGPLCLKADTDGQNPQKLGTVAFVNSCSASAQESFERGVALLHSFSFLEGDRAFHEALAQDPHCAIAHWGIATLLIGNTFSTGASREKALLAQQAIDLGRTIQSTPREHDYIEAIAAYYDDFARRSQMQRMQSLSDAFADLAKTYPDDDDAQIFDALYLTATQSPIDKSHARTTTAAAILEKQFAKNPNHPGAAHYLIHSYDYPDLSRNGLFAAICYSGIAPDAAHALHMPSHIFTRIGMWKNSIDTNIRSISAAAAEDNSGSVLHAMDYAVYADLQLGRDREATEMAQDAHRFSTPELSSMYARAAIPARYTVERDQWREAAALPDPDESRFPYAGAMTFFARALGAARSGNPAAAETDAIRLASIAEALRRAGDLYWATEVDVQHVSALAWIAFVQGKQNEALSLMRSAADMEDSSEKNAISPGRILPARELLGDMLLESGHADASLAAYEASQVRDPQRYRTLFGAAKASEAAGDEDKSRAYFARLVQMADGGSTRTSMTEARYSVAKSSR